MRTAVLCVILMLVPGCAGIITGEKTAQAPLPQGWGYAATIEFVDAPSPVPTEASAKALGLDTNTKDSVFGITAALSKVPLVGWMFAASKAGDIAASGIGGGNGGPVTDGVFKAAIASGRVKRIVWTPVKAEDAAKAPAVEKAQ